MGIWLSNLPLLEVLPLELIYETEIILFMFSCCQIKPIFLDMQRSSRSPLPPQVVHLRHTRPCDDATIRTFTSATGGRCNAKNVLFFFSTCFVCFLVHLLNDSMSNFPCLSVLPIAQQELCVILNKHLRKPCMDRN